MAKDLKSHYRVLHKIIAKCVVLKAGSSDIVNYEQKFYMCNYMAGKKINLPKLIQTNMIQAVVGSRKGVADKKNVIKFIPYGVLLSTLMAKDGIVRKLKALINKEEHDKYFENGAVVHPDVFGEYNLVRMKLINASMIKKVKTEQKKTSTSTTVKSTRSSETGIKRIAESPARETRSKRQKVLSVAEPDDEDMVPIRQILEKKKKAEAEKKVSASVQRKKVPPSPPVDVASKGTRKRLVKHSELDPKVLDFTVDESVSIFDHDDVIPAPPLSVSQPQPQTQTQTQAQTQTQT